MLKALRANLASCTLLAGVVAPGVLGLDSGAPAVRASLRKLMQDRNALDRRIHVAHAAPAMQRRAMQAKSTMPSAWG